MRLLVWFLAVLLLSVSGFATTVPGDITKTVVFLYRDGPTPNAPVPHGTGFLIGVPDPAHPNQNWIYLVTAKHALHTNKDDFNSPLYPHLYVRLNRKSGPPEWDVINVVTSGSGQTVFLHPDESVDVAVVPIHLLGDAAQYDALLLDETLLATKDDITANHIGVGTDVFFAGMFTPYLGQSRSYPIVRFGRVSMLPEEKVRFGGQDIEAYLVESFAFGGNSGSPVFFYLGADRTPGSMILGPPILKIAGLMKGSYNDVEPIQVVAVPTTPTQMVPISTENAGIAVVIPAQKIRDILHSKAVEDRRR